MAEKSQSKILKEKLFTQKKNGYKQFKDIEKMQSFCEDYKIFLNNAKTEREANREIIKTLESKGFKPFERGATLNTGDKIYINNRNKAVLAAVIGKEDISKGLNIIASHIDSPRLDLKPNPLYEDGELALLKTHYYGGIKKYQWTAIPLSLHGVVVKGDGSCIEVTIGEDESDPVFCITDLLPHLAVEQMKRDLKNGIKGEELNILIGSMPFIFEDDEASEAVKLNILNILNEKYGLTEDDFLSAELELVPQFKAKNVGFDNSLIGSYGQDDRVCAYTSLQALLQLETPEKTAVAVFADKEEIGSTGNTGLRCKYLMYFIEDLAHHYNVCPHTVFENSACISADVNSAYDPTFGDVFEKRNCAQLNHGIVVTKYTGAGGKSGASDASAEFVGKIRKLFDENGVIWQTGELGKVDNGGGGTVAAYIANLNIDTLDVGVPVLSMHAPFEITSKLDVYMAYLSYLAFFK
ncbi:MAG: aminopeptidase [Oscillospiraceae bacterium]|jgi:aspartyl aminopeptidase|nr:aminopeptidase [Oscillospiraceae bacterium]